MSQICGSAVRPYDHRATVADVRERVGSIEAGTDRQLETIQENLDVLDETLGQAYAAIGDVDIWVSSTVSIADDLQIILGNELVPAVYISRRDDRHESPLPREPRTQPLKASMELSVGDGPQKRRQLAELRDSDIGSSTCKKTVESFLAVR